MGMALLPHPRIPLELDSAGEFVVVEQDSLAEVKQCVVAILTTPLGVRELHPTMGFADTTHLTQRAGESATRRNVEQQLALHEPRAEYHATIDGETLEGFVDSLVVNVTGVRGD